MRKTKHDHLRRGAAIIQARALFGPSGALRLYTGMRHLSDDTHYVGFETDKADYYPGPLTEGNRQEPGCKRRHLRWPLPPVFKGAGVLDFVVIGSGKNWFEALLNARRCLTERLTKSLEVQGVQ